MKRIIASIMLLLLILSGCDRFELLRLYPWYKAEMWYCEEIGMYIEFSVDVDGDISEAPVGYIEEEDMRHPLLIGFRGNDLWFGSEPDEHNVSWPLLTGNWEYEKESLIITVQDDQLFGGRYSKLIFIPQ